MVSIAKQTEDYIRAHASIRYCLKKGLINYSALARAISTELKLKKQVNDEAIVVAARRFREKTCSDAGENEIINLFKKSDIEIKNNICILTLDKGFFPEAMIDIERSIKKRRGVFFAIESTKSLTIITENEYAQNISKKFKNFIITKNEDLSLITITSKGIDSTPGAVAYITGLFFENSINIEEFMSCYDDTLIVIKSEYVQKAIGFLNL
jgi:hypothetical protein